MKNILENAASLWRKRSKTYSIPSVSPSPLENAYKIIESGKISLYNIKSRKFHPTNERNNHDRFKIFKRKP